MRVRRLANHAGPLSKGAGVRCRSCAAVFPFLPARRSATRSLEPSRPRRTLQSIRLCLYVRQRSWGPLHPSQVCSHKLAAHAFPHYRAHVPFVSHPALPDRFHRAEFRDVSVLVGQRNSQPEMGSASGLGSRLWSALGESRLIPSPASSIPTLGFRPLSGMRVPQRIPLFAHRRGLDTATNHKPLIRLPGSIRS